MARVERRMFREREHMSIKQSIKFLLTVAACSCAFLGTSLRAQDAAPGHSHPAQADHADHADHGGDHAEHPKGNMVPKVEEGIAPAIVSLVVFSLVLAIASAKVWPKISGGLRDREDKIRTEIEGAEMARQQAKDALEQYQKSLADARAETSKMLETTRAQQTALAAELKASSEKDLAEMRERAKKDIEAAKRAAVAELYEHASNLGAMIASKILKREVNANDTNMLVEESLRQLQGSKN